MKRIFYFIGIMVCSQSLLAQADNRYAQEDARQRGWYDRPWTRYEAEPEKCTTNGTFLVKSDENADVQSEATNQIALNLNKQGDYVEWEVAKNANAITIRFSLPDNATTSTEGTGTKET